MTICRWWRLIWKTSKAFMNSKTRCALTSSKTKILPTFSYRIAKLSMNCLTLWQWSLSNFWICLPANKLWIYHRQQFNLCLNAKRWWVCVVSLTTLTAWTTNNSNSNSSSISIIIIHHNISSISKLNNNSRPLSNKLTNSRISIPFSSKTPSNNSSSLIMDSPNSNKWTPPSCLHLPQLTKKSNKITVAHPVIMGLKTTTAVTWVTQSAKRLHSHRLNNKSTIISKMRQTNNTSSKIFRIWMCSLISKMGANKIITTNKYKATLQVSSPILIIHTISKLIPIH